MSDSSDRGMEVVQIMNKLETLCFKLVSTPVVSDNVCSCSEYAGLDNKSTLAHGSGLPKLEVLVTRVYGWSTALQNPCNTVCYPILLSSIVCVTMIELGDDQEAADL